MSAWPTPPPARLAPAAQCITSGAWRKQSSSSGWNKPRSRSWRALRWPPSQCPPCRTAMHADELARLPMFAGLTPEQLTRLAGHFKVMGYQEGKEIFAAGDRADQLYLLRSGEVVIRYRPYDGG